MLAPPHHEAAKRVYHCTFYKCGSQWVRDLLVDPRIVQYSQCRLAASGVEVSSGGWPVVPTGSVASPVYTVGVDHWPRRPDAAAGDRAIVLLRDPRDMIVSLVFSLNFSHTPDAVNRLLRRPIRNALPSDRIRLGMHMFSHWYAYFASWADSVHSDARVVRYEALLEDEVGEFQRLLDFLGWEVPVPTVVEVVQSHSFLARSGRKRGVENEFSHRRKGIAGDWRNHFTRDLGQLFELSFPALLTRFGYESSDTWWQSLPNAVSEEDPDAQGELSRLLVVLEQHEAELALLRGAAKERLDNLEALTAMYQALLQERNSLELAARDRLQVIAHLQAQLTDLRRDADAAGPPATDETGPPLAD